MANRYWVGGTATWDATVGTKWATTSGGGGGSAVPTAADDVFFDAASGAVTITTSGTTTDLCRSLNCTGFTGTLSHAASTTITIGDATAGASNIALKLVAGMTYTKGSTTTSAITFVSTSATQQTITFGTQTTGHLTLNGAGGSWQFQDDLTGASTTQTGLLLTRGSLDTNGKTVVVGYIDGFHSNTISLTLGSSTVTLNPGGSPWLIKSPSFTFNAGTSTINFDGGGSPLIYGSQTFNVVNINPGAGGITQNIAGANTFSTLTITGPAVNTGGITLSADQTITGTLTINGNSLTNRFLISSSALGTARTITAATVSLSNVDFQDITGAGAASPFTGTSLGNALGNSGITFTTAATQYWFTSTTGTKTWSTAGNWFLATGGTGGAGRVPLPQDNVVFDASSIGAASTTVQTDMPRAGADINFTGVTNTPTLSFSAASTLFGSLTLVSGMTLSSTSTLTFGGRSSLTLTSAGRTFLNDINISMFGGTLTLQDDLIISSTNGVLHYDGTLSANDKNLTITGYLGNGSTRAHTINMGSGTWTITGLGTIWNDFSGLTINADTSTIIVNNAGATTKNFVGGGKTYNILTVTSDNVVITGSNTFATLNVNNAALTNGLKLTNGTTQTITSSFTTNGSAGNLAKLLSSTGGSAATLSKASGVVNVDYMSIQDSTATGGANWYAGANSTNVSNNSGWVFTAGPTSISVTDSVTVTENTAVTLSAIQINVSDSITVTENRLLVIAAVVNKSDSITVTENVSVLIPQLFTTVSDSVTVTESTTVLIPTLLVSLSDSVTITENRQIIVTESFGAFSSDIVTVSESLSVILSDPQINVSESIVITENSGLLLSVTINKSDSITVTENKNVSPISNVLVSDSITLTESRTLQKLRGNKNRTSYTRIGKSTTPYSRATKSTTPYDR